MEIFGGMPTKKRNVNETQFDGGGGVGVGVAVERAPFPGI